MVLQLWEEILKALVDGCVVGGFILFIFSLISDLSAAGSAHGHINISGHGHAHIRLPHIHIRHPHVHIRLPNMLVSHPQMQGRGPQAHTIHTDSNPAPFLLIVSTFMLSFGILGEVLFSLDMDSYLRLFLLIFIPFMTTKGTSLVWSKIAKEHSYEIPQVDIDNQVETITRVDERGGLVIADTSDIDKNGEKRHLLGKIKMSAKTRTGIEIPAKSIAYVIDIDEHQTLIIDQWPTPVKKGQKETIQ